jgi:hypothetical protein
MHWSFLPDHAQPHTTGVSRHQGIHSDRRSSKWQLCCLELPREGHACGYVVRICCVSLPARSNQLAKLVNGQQPLVVLQQLMDAGSVLSTTWFSWSAIVLTVGIES